uniref:Cholinergic receptor muscarinic 3 n=1 Tax=Tetraodon nigroviridis TaxID=99883 RepID=H3CFT1_TETNG
GDWTHHNVSHVLRSEGNMTQSLNGTWLPPADSFDPLGGHTVLQVIIIIFLTGSLSLVTVVGNILVLLSFKVNKALKTVNNYYLLSLAFADLTIGTLSMNLYTTYIIMDQWALGPVVCDLWLAIDYVASNTSVMNLLVISVLFRYFSVTRPLTYRAKRTTKRAMTMICLAWSISIILWAPAILFWQYIVGERTVQPNECYIQFLSEPIITFCTAIAAFYLPVTIMAILFWKIYQETEKRAKEVQGLKGSGTGNGPTQPKKQRQSSSQTCSSYDLDQPASEKKKSNEANAEGKHGAFWLRISLLCFSHRSGKRPGNNVAAACDRRDQSGSEEELAGEGPSAVCIIYKNNTCLLSALYLDDKKYRKMKKNKDRQSSSSRSQQGLQSNHQGSAENAASAAADRSGGITMKDAAMAKRFASKAKVEINKRKNEKKANDKKAARTLSAILFAFITTWLPYNIMVLVNTFCQDCIPETLWALGYWLCYVNSTVNPMCYALCNKTFRTTFRDILMCQWNQKKNKPKFQERLTVSFHKRAGEIPK